MHLTFLRAVCQLKKPRELNSGRHGREQFFSWQGSLMGPPGNSMIFCYPPLIFNSCALPVLSDEHTCWWPPASSSWSFLQRPRTSYPARWGPPQPGREPDPAQSRSEHRRTSQWGHHPLLGGEIDIVNSVLYCSLFSFFHQFSLNSRRSF